MNPKYARVVIAGLVLALTLAACGGEDGGSAPAVEMTLTLDNTFVFTPPTLTAQIGQTIKLTIENTGALDHTFRIDEFGVNSGTIAAGGTQTVTFTPNKAGTFTFYCDTPGHKEGGMTGTLTVTP